jgi:translation initiation factor IF-2
MALYVRAKNRQITFHDTPAHEAITPCGSRRAGDGYRHLVVAAMTVSCLND